MPNLNETAPVTVVIPAYNGVAYLGAAIASVRAQTLPVAELVVVDDGSTDDTASIAEAAGARVVRRQNGGVAAARNAGVQAAGQPWVAFLDQDDLWEREKIERQWAAAKLCPEAGIISGDFCQFEGERIVVESFLSRDEVNYGQYNKTRAGDGVSLFPRTGEDSAAGDFIIEPFFCPSAVMVKRDAILEAGLFDASFDGVDEFECFMRVRMRWPLAVVERPLMRYRLHDHNVSKDSLKLLLANIAISKKISAHPERYPKGAPRAYRAQLPGFLTEAGRLLLHQGRTAEARRLFAESLQERFSLSSLAYWATACLGPKLFNGALALKRLPAKLKSSG